MWEDSLRLLPEVTACVMGEGEVAVPQLLAALEAGADLVVKTRQWRRPRRAPAEPLGT